MHFQAEPLIKTMHILSAFGEKVFGVSVAEKYETSQRLPGEKNLLMFFRNPGTSGNFDVSARAVNNEDKPPSFNIGVSKNRGILPPKWMGGFISKGSKTL